VYARAFGSQALLDAWAQVRDAALTDGPDNAVAAFEQDAAGRLDELGAALADGSWEPSPVTRVEVAKPTGGVRILGVPPLADRIVERALLRVLDPLVDPRLLPWRVSPTAAAWGSATHWPRWPRPATAGRAGWPAATSKTVSPAYHSGR
jgi:hypothetical protein